MRRLILGVKLTVLALWTALAFGLYALLNLLGDALIRHSDVLPVEPELVAFVSWLLGVVQSLGFGLIVGIWLLGAVAILVIGWLARRLAPPTARPMPPAGWRPSTAVPPPPPPGNPAGRLPGPDGRDW